MEDVQIMKPLHEYYVDLVGINNYCMPVSIEKINTVADIDFYIDLDCSQRGIHMSRLVRLLNEMDVIILDYVNIVDLIKKIKDRTSASTAFIKFKFPYFIRKTAPKSEILAQLKYTCEIEYMENVKESVFKYSVSVPVTTVCPCSKAISDEGAHNQRGIIKVEYVAQKDILFYKMIKIIEKCGSAPIFTALKREDEKYVTEVAYRNPMFVEDVARNVKYELEKQTDILDYSVEVINFESIHSHNAYAYIKGGNIHK